MFKIVMNRVGWLDDRHGPSPILYDTLPLFVYTDQLLCRCIFIWSNLHRRLIYLVCDGFLYCFCLLAESYETMNHYRCQNRCTHYSQQLKPPDISGVGRVQYRIVMVLRSTCSSVHMSQ